ncbi:uncharacterized protein LOC126325910 isoform X1 [Schistocerca gregaria]|uniref:uncharacterized protein LOC126325910 isoform X1 n=1 Tax=Schistocerca gregaria TaxID=7010 RepID=UPI00211EECEA|nr:uncharacterized protein LOC126325910 isoform X1 [Schistocerca gregaria]
MLCTLRCAFRKSANGRSESLRNMRNKFGLQMANRAFCRPRWSCCRPPTSRMRNQSLKCNPAGKRSFCEHHRREIEAGEVSLLEGASNVLQRGGAIQEIGCKGTECDVQLEMSCAIAEGEVEDCELSQSTEHEMQSGLSCEDVDFSKFKMADKNGDEVDLELEKWYNYLDFGILSHKFEEMESRVNEVIDHLTKGRKLVYVSRRPNHAPSVASYQYNISCFKQYYYEEVFSGAKVVPYLSSQSIALILRIGMILLRVVKPNLLVELFDSILAHSNEFNYVYNSLWIRYCTVEHDLHQQNKNEIVRSTMMRAGDRRVAAECSFTKGGLLVALNNISCTMRHALSKCQVSPWVEAEVCLILLCLRAIPPIFPRQKLRLRASMNRGKPPSFVPHNQHTHDAMLNSIQPLWIKCRTRLDKVDYYTLMNLYICFSDSLCKEHCLEMVDYLLDRARKHTGNQIAYEQRKNSILAQLFSCLSRREEWELTISQYLKYGAANQQTLEPHPTFWVGCLTHVLVAMLCLKRFDMAKQFVPYLLKKDVSSGLSKDLSLFFQYNKMAEPVYELFELDEHKGYSNYMAAHWNKSMIFLAKFGHLSRARNILLALIRHNCAITAQKLTKYIEYCALYDRPDLFEEGLLMLIPPQKHHLLSPIPKHLHEKISPLVKFAGKSSEAIPYESEPTNLYSSTSSYFRTHIPTASSIYQLGVQMYCNTCDMDGIYRLLKRHIQVEEHVQLTDNIFSILLDSLSQHAGPLEPLSTSKLILQMLETMESKQLVPTYQHILSCLNILARIGDLDTFYEVLQLVPKHNLQANETAFCYLVRAQAAAKKWEPTKNIFSLMKAYRVEPTPLIHLVILEQKLMHQQITIDQLLSEAEKFTLYPVSSSKFYSIILCHFCSQKNTTMVEKYLEIVRKGYVHISTDVYDHLLKLYASTNDLPSIDRLASRLTSSSQATRSTYLSIAKAYLQINQDSKAFAVIKLLTKKFRLHPEYFEILIGLQEDGTMERTINLLKKLTKCLSAEPKLGTLKILLDRATQCNDRTAANSLLKRIRLVTEEKEYQTAQRNFEKRSPMMFDAVLKKVNSAGE